VAAALAAGAGLKSSSSCYVFLLQGSVLSVLFHRLYYLSVCETERSKIEAPLLGGVANHGSVNTSTTNAPIRIRKIEVIL